MSEAVIRVEGLCKTYPKTTGSALFAHLGRSLLGRPTQGTHALHDLSFEVGRGEALGVVGRNGSGKSTLLQILAGALRPSAGTVSIDGRIGTLLDLTAGIDVEYTGAENAIVLGMLGGLSRADALGRMEAIRSFSGLGDAFDRPVKGYSSGMTMRLGFSAAIHSDPDVMLIDEALAVGDAFYQQRCLRKMRELRADGVTIVLVSHDPSAVISLCDRAIWLEHGEVREAGVPKDVLRQYLAARYEDDCDLGDGVVSVAPLETNESEPIVPAAPLTRIDERFGDGRARVSGFEVRGRDGATLSTLHPNEEVRIVVSIESQAALASPLVGFTLRNRLGDVITASNTELEGVGLPALEAGESLDVEFRFEWPALGSGPVTLSPAIADGCIAAHAMCDWIENAIIVECENERGLFGWLTLEDVSVGVGAARRGGAEEADVEQASVDLPSNEAAQEEDPVPGGEGEATMADHIEFALDEPRQRRIDPGSLTEDRELLFTGWSFSGSGDPVEVVIRVDCAEEKIVVPEGFREDVALAYGGSRHASRSGFAAMVRLPDRVGPVGCEIEVRTSSTSRVAAQLELDLPAGPVQVDEVNPPRPRSLLRAHEPGEAKTPRVLFVTHTLNLEGAPRSLFEMARGIVLGPFEGMVVSPVDGPLGELWEDAGFAKRVIPVDVRAGGRDDYDAMIRRLAALLSAWRPDLIVANTLEVFWAVHVAKELGLRVAWIVRESEDPSVYFHSRLPTAIASRGVHALEVADRVVFVAEATRALFHARVPRDRSLVIPNGLDLNRIEDHGTSQRVAALRSDLGIAPETHLLLCVGTPCTRKGQLELIDALSVLRARNLDFRCVFLGVRESDYVERMRVVIETEDLDDHVLLVPPTREPLGYFAAADLVVCPSFQESLPRVVLEAMAFAKPIVASRVFGVPELIRDEREGRLVEAGDIEGLARAIEDLVTSRDRAASLGRNAKARVEERFTLAQCVDGYASLFRELVDAATDEAAG